MSREQELDRLEQELRERRDRPYIEKPDERELSTNGACFLDRDRMCGPDCTSFQDPDAPTAAERCVILSGVQSGLSLLGELVHLKRNPAYPRAVPAAPSVPPPYVPVKETR